MGTIDTLYENFVPFNYGEIIVNIALFIALIILGVFLGKLTKFILRKLIEKSRLEVLINKGVIEAALLIIKWSIYILFFNLALVKLDIPSVTKVITDTIIIVPAITGSLFILAIGFALATSLRKIIDHSGITFSDFLSKLFFYFVNGVAIIYAIRLALVSIDNMISSIVLLIFAALYGLFVGLSIFKKIK